MFCPLVKGDCVPECIFNNGCFSENDPENCNLMDAIRNIRSDGFDNRSPRDYFDNIEATLASIKSSTSDNQSESLSINNKLDDVLNKLDEIKKKL